MAKRASKAVLVPLSIDIKSVLHRVDLPQNITEVVDLYACLADRIREKNLTYLTLPSALSCLADDPLYQTALYWGRGFYYDALYGSDEQGELVRVPSPYDRQEVRVTLCEYLSLNDPRVSLQVALTWRVGVCVGWLSGLAVSQRDDALAGLVFLAAVVAPLLCNVPARQPVPSAPPKLSTKKSSRRRLR